MIDLPPMATRSPEDAIRQHLKNLAPGRAKLVAERARISKHQLSRWKNSEGDAALNLEMDTLKRLAFGLEMSVGELLTFPGERPAESEHRPAGVPKGPDSVVQRALKHLRKDDVLLMQLEPARPRDRAAVLLQPGSTVHVDKVLSDDPSGRFVVGRVLQPIAIGADTHEGSAHPAPLGRQHSGKARGFRRQPALGVLADHEVDDEPKEDDEL